MQVWKVPLTLGANVVLVPYGAALLHVGQQDGEIMLWAMVDPDAQKVARAIHVIGTGFNTNLLPNNHIGTVQMPDGFVWHVFMA